MSPLRLVFNNQYHVEIGRPTISQALESMILRLAEENPSWGYDRISDALANLGHDVSDQTIGNILKKHGIPKKRRKGGKVFIFCRETLK